MFTSLAAILYQPLYLLIIAIIMFFAYQKYRFVTVPGEVTKENIAGSILVVLFFIFFIGLRPVDVLFNDMGAYDVIYNLNKGHIFLFDSNAQNFLFDNLFNYWSAKELGITNFFLLLAAIYFGASFLGIRRLFPHHTLMAYLVFLSAFSTFSYATNGVKAGAAASLFIWALSYRKNLVVCLLLMLVSWGFHHSMILPIMGFIATIFFKNPKYYYLGWVFCFLVALFHINFFSEFFAGYADESGAGYLMGDSESEAPGSFRIDFIIYSFMPVLIGFILEVRKNVKVSLTYSCLIHLYTFVNGVWMLCMYASFTNRIAYLSWFLYPIVLIYPFLYENWGPNKNTMFRRAVLLQFAFTLFMVFIYYGGLTQILFR